MRRNMLNNEQQQARKYCADHGHTWRGVPQRCVTCGWSRAMVDQNADGWKDKYAPVQGNKCGTITWNEHELAWEKYNARYHGSQNAERIAQRGGFYYSELQDLLGYDPKTWKSL